MFLSALKLNLPQDSKHISLLHPPEEIGKNNQTSLLENIISSMTEIEQVSTFTRKE